MNQQCRDRAEEMRTEEVPASRSESGQTGRPGMSADVMPTFRTAPVDAEAGPERLSRSRELGMATAEYAIATLAAVGFAGLLVVILRSDEVRGFLLGLIRNALSIG